MRGNLHDFQSKCPGGSPDGGCPAPVIWATIAAFDLLCPTIGTPRRLLPVIPQSALPHLVVRLLARLFVAAGGLEKNDFSDAEMRRTERFPWMIVQADDIVSHVGISPF
jgi:hypothetical protein